MDQLFRSKGFLTALFAMLFGTWFGMAKLAYTSDAPFNVSIRLLSPITVTTDLSLTFPPILSGTQTDLTVNPSDTNAAVFIAVGSPDMQVVGGIVESSIVMIAGSGSANERIPVDSFVTGGDMDTAGTASFSKSGTLDDLRVGATAHIKNNTLPGAYSGNATFRLLYK